MILIVLNVDKFATELLGMMVISALNLTSCLLLSDKIFKLLIRIMAVAYENQIYKKEKLQRYDEFRRKSTNFDFKVKLNGHCYSLHQEILKTNAYFAAMFRSNMQESQLKST